MIVKIVVHPKSKQPRILEDDAGVLHVYVSEIPVGGKANDAVRKALIKHFDTERWRVTLLKGHLSKHKQYEIVLD